MSFADFYANSATEQTVLPGDDVSLPLNGSIANTNIGRISDNSFLLAPIGSYQIIFRVNSETESELVLTLNGVELDYTRVGNGTPGSVIFGSTIVTTTAENSTLTLSTPADATSSVVIPGGVDNSNTSHLTIVQLS